MVYSTPGFPVLYYLLEFAQTHVHGAGDAIQPLDKEMEWGNTSILVVLCAGERDGEFDGTEQTLKERVHCLYFLCEYLREKNLSLSLAQMLE